MSMREPDLVAEPDLFGAVAAGFDDVGLAVLRLDGTVASWSIGAQRLTERSVPSVVGRAARGLFARAARFDHALTAAGESGRHSFEAEMVRADGDSARAQVELRALRIRGQHRGYLLRFVDPRGDDVETSGLRESEARFRAMADGAPVLLWMAGTDGLCYFFNQRWLDFTGRTMAQEQGNGWAEGVHPEDFQGCMQTFLTEFVARRPFAMEYRLRRHDGVYRWIYDQGAPRFESDGTFSGYIGSCTDITERKEAEEALRVHEMLEAKVRDRTQALSLAVREREVLLRELHHRVKNNLQMVSSLLSMQARQIGAPAVGRALTECQQRVDTIAAVHAWMTEAHHLSRLQLGAYLTGVASSALSAGGGARIVLDADAVEDVLVGLDVAVPAGLIVNELVTNAAKHAFPDGRGGRVWLEVARSARGLLVAVGDDGVGLPPGAASGASLGLLIVADLTAQLQGELAVTEGPPTRFAITIPFAAAGEVRS